MPGTEWIAVDRGMTNRRAWRVGGAGTALPRRDAPRGMSGLLIAPPKLRATDAPSHDKD